jgi:biopolymer transport protein ExbD
MAEVEIKTTKKKSYVKYLPKNKISVDLTPMVDLGFLLITFFIVTTSLNAPTVAGLVMPKDDKEEMPVCESCTLTLLPQANDEIYYYEGMPATNTIIHKTGFLEKGGLRDLIQSKQQRVLALKGSKDETVVIIKPGTKSSYKNMMDILDELKINNVTRYFFAEEDTIDKKLIGNE